MRRWWNRPAVALALAMAVLPAVPAVSVAAEDRAQAVEMRNGLEIYQSFREGLAHPECGEEVSERWRKHYAAAPGRLASRDDDTLALFGYVVDAVCPLVTKVHHEVKTRAGKGFQIVYVGHEGHEEAVGTMAVAPDAIHRVESVEEVDAAVDAVLDAPRSRGGRCRASWPARLPRRAAYVIVRQFMAHHQGMSLLALVNLLRNRPMPRRLDLTREGWPIQGGRLALRVASLPMHGDGTTTPAAIEVSSP